MGEVWEELVDSILRWDVLESVCRTDSRTIADGTKPVETRFFEGSHFVKGRFGEFGT